ncbi:putative diguanylate cyclase YedQ [Pseudomonas atacamensis]|uniref:diguanylate cyclase n=1 Tax=Pseudomonas atacamensis TaxID=2565368 RepID=UPI0022C88116|nr:diguanylate cyclase [Pseudomonas atacamensis]GLH20057.1 putative diguanylate cyclase YedQ [Pseudomonas atacamensis]
MQWQALSTTISRVTRFSKGVSPRRTVVACFSAVFVLTAILAARQYWLIYEREIDSRQYNLHLQAIAVDSGIDAVKIKLHFLRVAAERNLLNGEKQIGDVPVDPAFQTALDSERDGVWKISHAPENAQIVGLSDAHLRQIPGLTPNPGHLAEDLQLAQFMSRILPVEYLQGENLANVLYLSTSGIIVAYPAIEENQVGPALSAFAASNLINFSPLSPFETSYIFIPRLGNLITTGHRLQFGTPVVHGKEVRGAIVFDLPQERLQEYMQKTTASGEVHVLLDRQGRLIASNQAVFSDDEKGWLKTNLGGVAAPSINELLNTQPGIYKAGDHHLIYRGLDRSDLILVDIIPNTGLRWAVISQFSTLFVCIWIALGFLMLMTLFVVDLLLKRQLRLNEQLSELSLVDTLTQLANRRRLTSDFRAMANRSRGKDPIALMMVDIDKFKLVNDNWGHSAGDEVLKHLATQCRASVRSQDLVARYGGEEFCVLLPGATLAEASMIAEKMRFAIGESVCIPDARTLSSTAPSQQIRITVSIGVAESISDGCDRLDDLVAKADSRLYLAKQHGRNRVISDDQLLAPPVTG